MWDVLGCDDPLLSGPVRVVTALPLNERSLHGYGDGGTEVLGYSGVTINRLIICLPVPGTGNTQDD
jgi:hypothetical protein